MQYLSKKSKRLMQTYKTHLIQQICNVKFGSCCQLVARVQEQRKMLQRTVHLQAAPVEVPDNVLPEVCNAKKEISCLYL